MSKTYEMIGYVEDITSRRSRYDAFDHNIQINTKSYRLFNNSDICLLKKGDLVKFNYTLTGQKNKYFRIDEVSIKILNPMEHNKLTNGFVYILSNPSMPNLLKIGYTKRSPAERAAELYRQSTGIPQKFKVEWHLHIQGDPHLVEKIVHNELKDHKHGKEFFDVHIETAKHVIEEVYTELYPESIQNKKTIENIIDKRQQKLNKRREKLRNELKEKQAAIQAEIKQREYEKTDEYKWLKNGTLTYSPQKVLEPQKTHFSFFEKFFKEPPEPFIDFEISCFDISNYDNNYSHKPFWRVFISGIHGWDYIGHHSPSPSEGPFTFQQAFLLVEEYYNKYPFYNIGISLDISVSCIDNKDEIPIHTPHWEKKEIEDLSMLIINGLPQKLSFESLIDESLKTLTKKRVSTFKKAVFTKPQKKIFKNKQLIKNTDTKTFQTDSNSEKHSKKHPFRNAILWFLLLAIVKSLIMNM